MRRVVVTGMGLVTPLGSDVKRVWEGLLNGKSGLGKIVKFAASEFPCQVGGEVFLSLEDSPDSEDKTGFQGFPAPPDRVDFWNHIGLSLKERRRMDPFIQYAVAASSSAISDSGYEPLTEEASYRTGVLIGSGIGGVRSMYNTTRLLDDLGARRISPFTLPYSLINLLSGEVAIRNRYLGPNYSVVSACSTGAHALGEGARTIFSDDADVMIVGGSESSVDRLSFSVFCALRSMSVGYNSSPLESSRPWDKDRDGFVMSEGSGVLVLEEYEHARKRGARIYAELVGYGASGDGHHITAPDPSGSGPYRAMRLAFTRAGLNAEDVGYGNAHSTSTLLGDDIELRTIERLYGSAKDGLSISSTKSSLGHSLGATGAIEAILSICALQTGDMPPTLNLHSPSTESSIDRLAHFSKKKDLQAVFSNSFGFGGTNVCLLFSKC